MPFGDFREKGALKDKLFTPPSKEDAVFKDTEHGKMVGL